MAKPSPSKLADQYQTYPTAAAAATAALRGITDKTNERGGGILYNKELNVYAATDPAGQSNGEHFAAAVSIPAGWALHSTYHTHPSGQYSTRFSDDDIGMAQQLKAPSYVLARDDDKIRMFDPASSKISTSSQGGSLNKARFSDGSLVNEAPPAPTQPPDPSIPATPPPAPPSVASAPPTPAPAAYVVPVTGSRITMKDFASKHRAQTTQYKHKIVHIKSGAPKRP